MRGSVPDALMRSTKMLNLAPSEQPRAIYKKLQEANKLQVHGKMQIVTQVSDLNPADDQSPAF